VDTPLEMEFQYWNFVPGAQLNVSIVLYTMEQVCVLHSTSESAPRPAGLTRHVVRIPGGLLNSGPYYVDFWLVQDRSRPLFRHNSVVSFDVEEGARTGPWYGRVPGVVRPKFEWHSEAISEA